MIVEYGFPLDHNWVNYKEGYVLFGAEMLHEFMSAEYGAQYRGDQAYDLSEDEKYDIRLESGGVARRERVPLRQVPGPLLGDRAEHPWRAGPVPD